MKIPTQEWLNSKEAIPISVPMKIERIVVGLQVGPVYAVSGKKNLPWTVTLNYPQ